MEVKACRLVPKLVVHVNGDAVAHVGYNRWIGPFAVYANCWSGKLAIWIDRYPVEIPIVGHGCRICLERKAKTSNGQEK